jgi:hypothetical protein
MPGFVLNQHTEAADGILFRISLHSRSARHPIQTGRV